MTKTASIPITDTDVCSSGYNVQYRPSYSDSWITLPTAVDSPILIIGLQPSTVYFYKISRTCCDSNLSPLTEGNFTTPE